MKSIKIIISIIKNNLNIYKNNIDWKKEKRLISEKIKAL